HTISKRDWSSDVCSSDLQALAARFEVKDTYDDVDVAVAQHFLDVVVGVLHLETRRERLRLPHVVVADGSHFHTGQPPQHRQVCDLRDPARANHAHADGIVHFLPAPCSLLPRNLYINPVLRLTVFSPLDTVPRPSTVNRHAGESRNSAPILPFRPAVMTSSASSTNVPLIAAPLPLRT